MSKAVEIKVLTEIALGACSEMSAVRPLIPMLSLGFAGTVVLLLPARLVLTREVLSTHRDEM